MKVSLLHGGVEKGWNVVGGDMHRSFACICEQAEGERVGASASLGLYCGA